MNEKNKKKDYFKLDDNFYLEKHPWKQYTLIFIIIYIFGLLYKFLKIFVNKKIYKKKGFLATFVLLSFFGLFLISMYCSYNHYLRKMDHRIKLLRKHHSKNYERTLKVLTFNSFVIKYLKDKISYNKKERYSHKFLKRKAKKLI